VIFAIRLSVETRIDPIWKIYGRLNGRPFFINPPPNSLAGRNNITILPGKISPENFLNILRFNLEH
jgi:hypothetical protein